MLKVKTRKQANSSLLDTSSSSLNSIRAGQKFQKRGRRGEERVAGRREEEERRKISLSLKEEKRRWIDLKEGDRRRTKEEKPPCECGPVLERIGASIEKDRVGANLSHFSDIVLGYVIYITLYPFSGWDTEAQWSKQQTNVNSFGGVWEENQGSNVQL